MARTNEDALAAVQPLSVDLRGLQRVGARPGFVDYLVQIWNYRHFIAYDAKSRVQSGNRRDRLGSAWLILNPILIRLILNLNLIRLRIS